MPHIDYYLSTISPSVYIAGTRMEEVAAKHGATVTYKPVDIGGLFSQTGGLPPPQRHPSRQAYRTQDLRRQATKAGLDLNAAPAHFPVNGAPAAYALIAAQQAGGGDLGVLVHALTGAVWTRDQNIADDEVIGACLAAAGFDPALVNSGLLSGAETYARNTEEAVQAGVFGVPFYITQDDHRFWGQDRIMDLDLHLSGDL